MDAEAEIYLVKSELVDTLKPNILLAEMSGLILQMLIEYTEYIQKHKETEKNKLSKARLIKLLDISGSLNGLGDANQSLKLSNKFISASNYLLKKELAECKLELENVRKSFQEL